MQNETVRQPELKDLLVRFLDKQADAEFDPRADSSCEVVPYDASPVQLTDPKAAWEEALAAARYFGTETDTAKWSPPPHWGTLVAAHESMVAVPFCLGNFPQLVRNFHLILQKGKPEDIKPAPGRPVDAPALGDWARQVAAARQLPEMLLALGALRLANHFAEAEAYVKANEGSVPPEWRAAWDNEKAALAWHAGRAEAARNLWRAMGTSVPVLFNRGMAELFSGDAAAGRATLTGAVASLPENSAWHHLGRLYLLLGLSS
jgi:hypothetical protein